MSRVFKRLVISIAVEDGSPFTTENFHMGIVVPRRAAQDHFHWKLHLLIDGTFLCGPASGRGSPPRRRQHRRFLLAAETPGRARARTINRKGQTGVLRPTELESSYAGGRKIWAPRTNRVRVDRKSRRVCSGRESSSNYTIVIVACAFGLFFCILWARRGR